MSPDVSEVTHRQLNPQEVIKIDLRPTELIKDGWERQHEQYPDGWWLKRYWESTEGSQRDAIIAALERGGDFNSLLEVGCNTGPNLRRIHQRWPGVDLMGMDIHPGAIAHGRDAAAAEGWHWSGYVGDLRELGLLGEGQADVVLSCYALAYLDPRDIQPVLEACVRAARRAVVLCEPMVLDGQEAFLPQGPGDVAEYWYDYARRLLGRGQLRIDEVSPSHGRLAHIVTLKK